MTQQSNIKPSIKIPFKTILLIESAALLLGLIFNYFFYAKALGLSAPIFVILLLLVLFCVASRLKIKIDPAVLWIVIPLLFFATMLACHNGRILTFVNLFVCFHLVMLLVYFITNPNVRSYGYLDYLDILLSVPFFILGSSSISVSAYVKQLKDFKKPKAVSQIIRGVLMALPILLIFVLLFASADKIFASYFWGMMRGIHFPTIDLLFWVRVALFTLVFTGLLKFFFRQVLKSNFHLGYTAREKSPGNLGVIEFSVVLGLLNLLFATFIFVQLKYLFGGSDAIVNHGLTYASYAREGFFQLIAVVLIAFAVIRCLESNVVADISSGHLFKSLNVVMIVQVIIITISAFKRLALYEDAYGYTELRLYSHIFIIFLMAVFVILAVKIVGSQQEKNFIFSLFVLVVVTVMATNLLNPQAFIARQNIARFFATDKLDVNYLVDLSSDAIPEIAKVADQLPEAEFIQTELCYYKAALVQRDYHWQSITLSGYRAKKALEQYPVDDKCQRN